MVDYFLWGVEKWCCFIGRFLVEGFLGGLFGLIGIVVEYWVGGLWGLLVDIIYV